MLAKEYASSASEKLEASSLTIGTKHAEPAAPQVEPEVHRKKVEEEDRIMIKNLGSKEIKAKEEIKKEEVKKPVVVVNKTVVKTVAKSAAKVEQTKPIVIIPKRKK
jgi:translation initiation factor IF-2